MFMFKNGQFTTDSDAAKELLSLSHKNKDKKSLSPEEVKDMMLAYYAKIINEQISFFELKKN